MRKLRLADLDVVLSGGPDREGGGDGPLLVLLHGYGAPGDDLVPLSRQLQVDRSVRFAFPAAPLALEAPGVPPDYAGRAWWQLDMVELQRAVMLGDHETLMKRVPQGLTEAREQVQRLLAALQAEHQLTPQKLVLGGFSQGSMLATDVTLHATERPAGLVIMSGSLICRDEWLPLLPQLKGLPVLQSHGRQDPILSYAIAEKLRDELIAAGAQVEFCPFNGGHGIPGGVLDALGKLLGRVTG
jgi:phospholipase/carboxylesterase